MKEHGERVKALVITQYYPPDITAASYRMEDLANAMKEAGIDTTIITATPHRVTSGDDEIGRLDKENGIIRVKVPKAGSTKLSRIINYLGFAFKATITAIFKVNHKIDIIVISSPPLPVAITGYILAKIKHTRLITDVRDIWPDTAVAAGMLKEDSILYKISLWLERLLYSSADQIICVSTPMKQHIAKYVDSRKVTVLYNGISEQLIKSAPPINAIQRVDCNHIMLVYAGNLGKLQGIDVLLRALSVLQKKHLDFIELILVGDGIEKDYLIELTDKLELHRVSFYGAVSREKVGEICSEADAVFLHLIDHPILEKTIPSKLFDYLIYGKPMVIGIRGEGANIAEQLQIGIFFEPGDEGELVRALLELKERITELGQRALTTRDFVYKNFYRPQMFKEYFISVIQKKGEFS